ncbi:hypothetical protein ACFKHW_20965 [Bradyrhizobium lupini]|uniref:hypothetical protein n=1 Tax=Rhizobium lupini TaxID=136996 RepID=UPI0036718F35
MRDDVLARKHAVRALRRRATVGSGQVEASEQRKRRYGATIKDAMTALWEASDRVCGRRLKLMIATLQLGRADHNRVLAISAATIDRLLVDVKIAANGGRRRRAGFYSAIRREAPIRTFNDGNSPPPVSAGSTWSPMAARRWPARHPNADDGRRRHGLDGVPAVAEAGRFARHRGD